MQKPAKAGPLQLLLRSSHKTHKIVYSQQSKYAPSIQGIVLWTVDFRGYLTVSARLFHFKAQGAALLSGILSPAHVNPD